MPPKQQTENYIPLHHITGNYMNQLIDFLADQWPLTLALAVITALLGRSFLEPSLSGLKDLKAQDMVRVMSNDNAFVLDVRLDKEYKEGHIINAINIPVGALESRIKEILDRKNNPVIIYCQTGMRSKKAGAILKKHGFETMYNLSGGLNSWINANLPLNKSGKQKQKK